MNGIQSEKKFDREFVPRHSNRISAPRDLTDDDCRLKFKTKAKELLEAKKRENILFANSPISFIQPDESCNVPLGGNANEEKATLLRSSHGCVAIMNILKGDKYFDFSGYDVSLDNFRRFSRNSFESELFAIAFERLECLRNINPLSFFLPMGTLNQIINLYHTEFPSLFGNIKLSDNPSSLPSVGNEGDFALIASLIISFCSRYGRGAEIELASENRSIIFSARAALKNGVEYFDILDAEKHWLYLINLIAEGNIWRFESEYDCGYAVFSLNLIVNDENEGFILCEETANGNALTIANAVAMIMDENESFFEKR